MNANHDCVTYKCEIKKDAAIVRHERQPTSMKKAAVMHSSPDNAFILNSHLFRSHEHLSIHYPALTSSPSIEDLADCAIGCINRHKEEKVRKKEAAEKLEVEKQQKAEEKRQKAEEKKQRAEERAEDKKQKEEERQRKAAEKTAQVEAAREKRLAEQPEVGVRSAHSNSIASSTLTFMHRGRRFERGSDLGSSRTTTRQYEASGDILFGGISHILFHLSDSSFRCTARTTCLRS